MHVDAGLHDTEELLDLHSAGFLSELCWADVTGRMCWRLMRDLRYLDFSHNCALLAAPAQEEDEHFVSGDCDANFAVSSTVLLSECLP